MSRNRQRLGSRLIIGIAFLSLTGWSQAPQAPADAPRQVELALGIVFQLPEAPAGTRWRAHGVEGRGALVLAGAELTRHFDLEAILQGRELRGTLRLERRLHLRITGPRAFVSLVIGLHPVDAEGRVDSRLQGFAASARRLRARPEPTPIVTLPRIDLLPLTDVLDCQLQLPEEPPHEGVDLRFAWTDSLVASTLAYLNPPNRDARVRNEIALRSPRLMTNRLRGASSRSLSLRSVPRHLGIETTVMMQRKRGSPLPLYLDHESEAVTTSTTRSPLAGTAFKPLRAGMTLKPMTAAQAMLPRVDLRQVPGGVPFDPSRVSLSVGLDLGGGRVGARLAQGLYRGPKRGWVWFSHRDSELRQHHGRLVRITAGTRHRQARIEGYVLGRGGSVAIDFPPRRGRWTVRCRIPVEAESQVPVPVTLSAGVPGGYGGSVEGLVSAQGTLEVRELDLGPTGRQGRAKVTMRLDRRRLEKVLQEALEQRHGERAARAYVNVKPPKTAGEPIVDEAKHRLTQHFRPLEVEVGYFNKRKTLEEFLEWQDLRELYEAILKEG